MKILFYGAQSYDKDSFNLELPKYPDVSIDYIESNLTPMTAGFAKGYDAVCAFVNADASILTLEILAGFDVKLLLMRCAGFDAVDVTAAKDLGITVTRVPAYSPEAIAEHAMGLALAANRRIHRGYIRIRENNFSLAGLVGDTLHGKTAGIVGTGRIGAALCRICKGFGMHVLGADLYPNMSLVNDEHVVDEYVSESYHMINDKTIGKMKDGVILVNTGRGGLIDTNALIRGILSGKIGACGLDVYEEENPNVYKDRGAEVFDSITSTLCSFPNVVMTSHQAFFTHEALAQIAQVTLDNATAFTKGADYVDKSVVC